MNSTSETSSATDALNRQDELSFLFAQLVLQQSNMAMMLLGKLAHPESGKTVQDVDAARLFIDQLEMLEVKTKGNLSKDEESLLKQTLMTLRLNFVQTIEASEQTAPQPKTSAPSLEPNEPPPSQTAPGSTASEDEENRKKFSKKY